MPIKFLVETDKFRVWFNKINEIITSLNTATDNMTGKSPEFHKSSEEKYGVGDNDEYGHLKLSDSLDNLSDELSGVASTPKAVNSVYKIASETKNDLVEIKERTSTIESTIENIQDEVSSKAIENHASTETKFGVGTNQNYGHVKLTSSISELGINDGYALVPSAVLDIDNRLTSIESVSYAPENHASESDIYGTGNNNYYGHVRLTDDLNDSDNDSSSGVAPSAAALNTVYEMVRDVEDFTESLSKEIGNKADVFHADGTDIYGLGNEELYGHVKLIDSVESGYTSKDGYAATPNSVRETYTYTKKISDIVDKHESILKTVDISGLSGSSEIIDYQDINRIVLAKTYISNTAKLLYNYPYENDNISVLIVANSNNGNALYNVYQTLYNESTIYSRKSLDSGETWTKWKIIGNTNVEQKSIYLSSSVGNDNNFGDSVYTPIKTLERFYEILKDTSIFYGSDNLNIPKITLFLEDTEVIETLMINNYPHPITISSYVKPIDFELKQEELEAEENTFLIKGYGNFGDSTIRVYSVDGVFLGYLIENGVSNEDYTLSLSCEEGSQFYITTDSSEYKILLQNASDCNITEVTLVDGLEGIEKQYLIDILYNTATLQLLFGKENVQVNNYPKINTLNIRSSKVVLENLIVNTLNAIDNSIVYMANSFNSIANMISNYDSRIFLSRTISSIPLFVHKHPTLTNYNVFQTSNGGEILDSNAKQIIVTENLDTPSFFFRVGRNSKIYMKDVSMLTQTDDIIVSCGQYSVIGTLYHPVNILGDVSLNEKTINSIVQGYLWGGGDTKYYLRADGTWSKVLDTVTLLVKENITLTEDNIKNVVLGCGAYTITIPSILENSTFVLKNISSELLTIHPFEVTIDGMSDDIVLKKNEFIEIVQFSENEYAIISDSRLMNYNLLDINLEDSVAVTNKTENV